MIDPLLADLAELLRRADPVPPAVRAAAEAAANVVAAWRDLDRGELALLGDSVLSGRVIGAPSLPAAGLRTAGTTRLLSFAGAGVSVEVELTEVRPRWLRLLGLVAPADDGMAVTVRWPSGLERTTVDAAGRFRAEGVPAGPLSLALQQSAGPPLVSDWLVG
jgi:hypothetical protein